MNKVFLRLFRIATLALAQTALASPLVTLDIQDRSGVDRTAEPVLMGVPLPEDLYLTNPGLFTLRDPAGTVIPCEFRVASTWLKNRSAIRWLHLDFQTDLAANASKKVVVHSETGAYQAASNLSVKDLGTKFEVNTGVLRFTVKKAYFNLLDEVWIDESGALAYDDAHKVVAAHARGLMMSVGTTPFHSSNDSATLTVVERQGPMALVLKSTGQLKAATGAGAFHFISRIYAYHNSKLVKIENTVENRGYPTTTFVVLSALKAELPLNLSGTKTALIGKPGGYSQAALAAAESAYSYCARPFGNLIDIRGTLGGKVSGTFDPKALKPRDVGWASLYDSSKGCAAGERDFWEMFPGSVEADGNGLLTVGLFSDKAGEPLQVWAGVSRTQTTRYVFFNNDSPAEQRSLAAGANNPLYAVAPPVWYCRRTWAFGPLAEKNPALYAGTNLTAVNALDAKIDNAWNGCFTSLDSEFGTDSYGFLAWGDALLKIWGPITDLWNLSWDGNYYDLAHMGFHHFARTGDLKYLDWGVSHANHIEDVHQCHFGPNPGLASINGGNRYCPPTNHVAGDQETVAHVETHPSHHKTKSMFENYWMTGDPRALDVALYSCDWLYQFGFSLTQGDNIATYTRRVSNLIHSLVYGYYQTKNTRYLSQLLINWNFLKIDIHDQVPMGADWQNGFLMEGLADLYYLVSDQYADPASPNHALKDSIMLYFKSYCNWKYGVTTSVGAIGYAFLSPVYGATQASRAQSLMGQFNTNFTFYERDFAELGRSLEMAMFYLAVPDSITHVVGAEAGPMVFHHSPAVSVYPNPVSSSAAIRIAGRVLEAPLQAGIWDSRGRRVARLDAPVWDATRVPAGVYVIRVSSQGQTLEKKIAVIR